MKTTERLRYLGPVPRARAGYRKVRLARDRTHRDPTVVWSLGSGGVVGWRGPHRVASHASWVGWHAPGPGEVPRGVLGTYLVAVGARLRYRVEQGSEYEVAR